MKKVFYTMSLLMSVCAGAQTNTYHVYVDGNGNVTDLDSVFIQKADSLVVTRSSGAGSLYQAGGAVIGRNIFDWGPNDIPSGVFGYVKNTGSNTPDASHGIGTFGLAEEGPGNKDYLIGVEGRTNGTGTGAPFYVGVLGYNYWKGASFDPALYSRYSVGMSSKAEVFRTDGVTPLNEGILINYHAPYPKGGASQFSGVFEAPLQMGKAGQYIGQTIYQNQTSGQIILQPASGALGNSVLTLPATSGTLEVIQRGTKETRNAIASPAQGLLFYVTDNGGYLSWYSNGWQRVSSVAD